MNSGRVLKRNLKKFRVESQKKSQDEFQKKYPQKSSNDSREKFLKKIPDESMAESRLESQQKYLKKHRKKCLQTSVEVFATILVGIQEKFFKEIWGEIKK